MALIDALNAFSIRKFDGTPASMGHSGGPKVGDYESSLAGRVAELFAKLAELITANNLQSPTNVITDPGDAGAIPVTKSGYCALVSTGAQTRTLAAPSFIGQRIVLYMKTDGGDITLTCATTFNETGNNTAVFGDTGDTLILTAVEEGSNLRWRAPQADGVALSTV